MNFSDFSNFIVLSSRISNPRSVGAIEGQFSDGVCLSGEGLISIPGTTNTYRYTRLHTYTHTLKMEGIFFFGKTSVGSGRN